MAIDPPSDIILEVAKAADPERAAAVQRRLTNLAAAGIGNGKSAGADFAAALGQTSPASVVASAPMPSAPIASAPVANASDMRARLANIGETQSQKANKARVQFEAVLLNSLVGEMLPKDAPDAYGEGLAGEMWRSMLADQVSRQIARSGTLGIGQRLFATHPLSASSSLGRAEHASHAGAAAATQMSANALSSPSGADIVDGAFLYRGAKPL